MDGWGDGTVHHYEYLNVFHNDTVSVVFSGFVPVPIETSGSTSSAQSVKLSSQIKIDNGPTWNVLVDTGLVPVASLNDIFAGTRQYFSPAVTGGGFAMDFERQITVTPDVGLGVYQNVGNITISRD